MTRKSRRCWSKSIGEPGRRVRLYEARSGGSIMRSVFTNGKEDRKSLGHRDQEKAIRQGYELLQALLANEHALDEESLTLGMVAELYKQSPAFASKKPRTQKADTRALERIVTFLGRSRNVETLSESDVQRFILARRQGVGSLPRVSPGKGVRDRAIESDLVILLTALNWATRERTKDGRRLLIEGKPAPRRPAPTREESEAAGDAARHLSPAAGSGGSRSPAAQARVDRGRGNGTAHLGVVQPAVG